VADANWVGTVYNGIDFEAVEFHPVAGDYLAFLGRISPEKRVDRAIEVARELDIPLKIAAKIDPVDQEYFEHAVRPYLNSHNVEFVGEVNESEKNEFLGRALAYLFPIDWPEPFGLTMIESMACGTPVVALGSGSVPEVVDHGTTGFVCSSLREFLACVSEVEGLDRSACRRQAQLRFSGEVMTDGYEKAYESLLSGAGERSHPSFGSASGPALISQ
jgi:glycosyltransferase involved in cell wall biosynthesis